MPPPRRRLFVATLILTLLAVAWPSPSHCQSATTGALAGAVTDPAGAALPHVTVTLANSATMGTQTAVTSANGAYTFLPAFSRRIRRAIRRPRIQDRPHVLGGRQCGRGPHARCRPGARRNRRARALPVPHHRHHLLHQHLRRFQNHHRRPPHHAQLHADSVDGLRLRRRRQQRRHPGTRHAQRQRQRQYQRRRLHPRRRLRPQRRPQPRHHFGTKDPNFSIRRGLRRAGPQHRPHHQKRRA